MAHPIGWMHALPVGESPGWQSNNWLQIELNQANIWNAPTTFRNLQDQQTNIYTADYEQTSLVFDYGHAWNDWLAFGIEADLSRRDGGVLDQFIDNFHVAIGSERFSRQDHPMFESRFQINPNGSFNNRPDFTNSYVKIKFKQWWHGRSDEFQLARPNGFSTSMQLKLPVGSRSDGLTSGAIDVSGLVHFGKRLFYATSMWLTAGFTQLGSNDSLDGWPRNRSLQMYEVYFEFGGGRRWNPILVLRMESPILKKDDLEIVFSSSDSESQAAEQVASAWNSLVHWRATQAFGIQYQVNTDLDFHFIFQEDFNVGAFDLDGSLIHTGNAPDVSFITQWTMRF